MRFYIQTKSHSTLQETVELVSVESGYGLREDRRCSLVHLDSYVVVWLLLGWLY